MYFEEHEDIAIFGLIPDVNIMLRKFFESGKATEGHKALLGNDVSKLQELQSNIVAGLRSQTGMPDLGQTFVWIGQDKPIFFIRLVPYEPPSEARRQRIEKLKSLTGLIGDPNWYYSHEHPLPARFRGVSPPPALSARRLQTKVIEELISRFPVDPNYKPVTFDELQVARYRKEIAQIDEKLKTAPARQIDALKNYRKSMESLLRRRLKRIDAENLKSTEELMGKVSMDQS
ncbi:hypothetical protein C8J56DRAFT_206430 [Mycena floridula]|nr:hypothetical protein C8J56DRAFT_206430 [Mycena floridula]